MSKVKWGFSLFFAFLLMGILSTETFAIDPYGLKPVQQSDLSLKVHYTANPSASPSQDETAKFDLYFVHPTDSSKSKTYTNLTVTKETDSGTGKVKYPGSYTIPAADIEKGTIYKLQLRLAGDPAVPENVLSTSSALVKDSHNNQMYHLPDSNVDINGSGQKNANLTGFNNTKKNRDGQKVHGLYQNNTNSCASCHQTHTGADDNLLFKDGVYSTCSACHDGTTGAYNAFKPIDDNTPNSITGTFDVLKDGHNGSLHVSDGTLNVSAAPGGNQGSSGSPWNQEFNCASCHAPHGAGSNNENNLNIDPLGWGSILYDSTTSDGKNGKLYKNIKIFTSVPTEKSDPYILVQTTTDSDQAKVDANYFYKRAGVTKNTPIQQTYRWGFDMNTQKDGYVPDYSLWLREKGYPYKADTVLYNDVWANLSLTEENHYYDSGKEVTADVHVVWRDGFAWGSGVVNVKSAQVSLGIDVETTDNIRSLFDSSYTVLDENNNVDPTKSYIPGSGTEMSKYCASCHTDYLSNARSDDTGVYSTSHRHKSVDNLTCVRCHFAHGSEAYIMKDANDNSYFDLTKAGKVFDTTGVDAATNETKALRYFTDTNPSSALKRYTGMAVCYACHGKGEQFMGNPNNLPDVTIGETLKAGEPGIPRTN